MARGAGVSDGFSRSRGGQLFPRRRSVDRAAMRPDGNHFRQLALCREVARDVRIVGSMIADVGKSFVRIEHEYLLAKLFSDQVERRNEVRITADEGNSINVAGEHIVEHVGCDIDVRPFFFQLDDMHSSVGGHFAVSALSVDRWHPDLVPVIISFDYRASAKGSSHLALLFPRRSP